MIPDGLLPFPQLCARIHDRVTAFLAEDVPTERLKSVQEQTRTSLGVLEEALERYRWGVMFASSTTASNIHTTVSPNSRFRTMAARTALYSWYSTSPRCTAKA